MAKVWHVKEPSFGFKEHSFPQEYELVAEVDTDKLEVAFELTNTIHCAWWENDGVTAMKQTRSTSVGDVVEIDGKHWRCEMMGWKELS
jgi:hypothetical protein